MESAVSDQSDKSPDQSGRSRLRLRAIVFYGLIILLAVVVALVATRPWRLPLDHQRPADGAAPAAPAADDPQPNAVPSQSNDSDGKENESGQTRR